MALVTFSSTAEILSPLTVIDGKASRGQLISKLPITAGGGTYICRGLRKGFEVRNMISFIFSYMVQIVFLTIFSFIAFGKCP